MQLLKEIQLSMGIDDHYGDARTAAGQPVRGTNRGFWQMANSSATEWRYEGERSGRAGTAQFARGRCLRNSLTTLGIAVGVASLVAMLSLGVGLQELATKRLSKLGAV